MVRPIYAHEMCDPDFSWLISTFKENHPEYVAVESSCLPIVLVSFAPPETKVFIDVSKERLPEESKEQFATTEEQRSKEDHR